MMNLSRRNKILAGRCLPGVFALLLWACVPQARAESEFWATNYFVHAASSKADGVALRTVADKVLTRVAKKDWCLGAIEGTIVVTDGAVSRTFNFAAKGSPKLDCTPFVSQQSKTKPWAIALGRTRWLEVDAPFGLGTKGFKLVPFRTIAVDPAVVPIGSVLHVEAAKGVKFTNASGTEEIHDGNFFAGDVGGAIKGNHIDVFTGVAPNKVFDFVKSKPEATFAATLVTDQAVIDRLKAMHQ